MIAFPNAKINLGLRITGKREDGYHDIQSILYPLALHDILEFRESERLEFKGSGLEIPGDPAENLCLQAYRLVSAEFDIPPIEILLHKVIPMGGGLGGGSSDGAHMLRMLNEYFRLEIPNDKLHEMAASLGSDCPFFLDNSPSYVSGKGTELEPASVDLSGYYIYMVFPVIHSSTREAYSGVRPEMPVQSLPKFLTHDPGQWPDHVINDFEPSVFERFPRLEEIKNTLKHSGALYAAMSGSGSSMFGIFSSKRDIPLVEKGLWIGL